MFGMAWSSFWALSEKFFLKTFICYVYIWGFGWKHLGGFCAGPELDMELRECKNYVLKTKIGVIYMRKNLQSISEG